MTWYLLDTNHLGQVATLGTLVHQRVMQRHALGHRFGTCLPVFCELEVGIEQVRDPAKYRRNLERVLRIVRTWPLDRETARIYGATYHELRKAGRALSSVDIMLAAVARQMKLVLLSTDRDFEALPDIRCENWTN